jgi:hypothetical protein
MSRVAVTEEIAEYIAARIVNFSNEADKTIRWLVPYVAKFSALPLYLGWVEIHGIRPDGEVVSWSTEGEYIGVRPVEDQISVLSDLVEGSGRYPSLRALLPARGQSAVDCRCRGHPLFESGKVMCGDCGGIGWLPAPNPFAKPQAALTPAILPS